MGFDAGDSNLYRYVNNDPPKATDPSGMDWGYGDWRNWLGAPLLLLSPETEFQPLWKAAQEGKALDAKIGISQERIAVEVVAIRGPANLDLQVTEKAETYYDTVFETNMAKMKIDWLPQNVKAGGFVIQHVSRKVEYTKVAGGPMVDYSPKQDIWEAWQVDANGKVYPGYKVAGERPDPSDLFRWPIPSGKTAGSITLSGFARYTEGFNVTWSPLPGQATGRLPATNDQPDGWSDVNSTEHGFKVTWDDFKGIPLTITPWIKIGT